MNRRWAVFAIAVLMLFVFVVAAQGSGGAPQKKEPAPALKENNPAQTSSPLMSAPPQSAGEIIPDAEVQPAGVFGENAPGYAVPWKSINGGGGTAQSSTHKVSLSIGQAAIGHVSGANYQAGIGFWYGMAGGGCNCGTPWGNLNTDNVVNAVDVVIIVNYVYKLTDQRTPLSNCQKQPGDVNCTDPINAVDVVLYVNYVYKAMTPFCANPCGP